jgi:Ni2+-binding GTPase involved in maturation of urease and hydrogenase
MKTTKLVIVGGFLGAGKTTLLYEATRNLMAKGLKVALITNDQAPDLVDTAILLQSEVNVAEVSGSCFCCSFNEFMDAVKQLKAVAQVDIIIAEPVGSCTDLYATLIRPLKKVMNTQFMISPLTVLAEPARLAAILEGGTSGLHASSAYVYRKQLEESDIILITKSDLLEPADVRHLKEKVKHRFPGTEVYTISSKKGEGIKDWLKIVLNKTISNQKDLKLDYDLYAEGEAVLAWLNSSVSLHGRQIKWNDFARQFLAELNSRIELINAETGHIKIFLKSVKGTLTGNITGKADSLSIRGNAGISNEANMILNARVSLDPEILEKLAKEALDSMKKSVSIKINTWRCFSPGYPRPTFRYSLKDDI